MIIVSDTTPIISLMKIEQLDLLEKLFGSVKIPVSVYQELTTNQKFKQEAKLIESRNFIDVVEVMDTKSVSILQRATGLDRGESEAIILAEEIKADLLLMDERKGRLIAKQMGNQIAGTLGIIISAYEENLITSEITLQCFEQLKKSGIRISDSLYSSLIDKHKSIREGMLAKYEDEYDARIADTSLLEYEEYLSSGGDALDWDTLFDEIDD